MSMILNSLRLPFSVLGLAVLVSGCNSTAPLDLPDIGEAPSVSEVGLNLTPEATFALTKIVANIKRGEVIGAFPSRGLDVEGSLCNYTSRGNDVVTWGSGRSRYLGDWSSELGSIFYEIMTSHGYSIAGDPTDLFSQSQTVKSSEYVVGGRLQAIKGNFCHQHHWWDGRPLYEYSGDFYVEVEWSILNTLTQDVVYKVMHAGRYRQEKPVDDGIVVMMNGAFAESAARLAAAPDVSALASGRAITQVAINKSSGAYAVTNGERPVRFEIDNMRDAVVTIRVGQGHGSGFFIGSAGLVLTNAHVVGEANTVQVRLASGVELTGRVVEKDKFHDVAVIDTGIRFSTPPYLERIMPEVATEVYAVGSPIKVTLESTVTRGIVSALRTDPASGRRFIQADVAISPGNSGGPLFNAKGDIIGLSAQKYSGPGAEGLGLFIPITDALSALGIALESGA
ncbi:trypsin-like serine protease [Pelagibius litoralis]|uniref:Trypsin-like serine protease n=1 Tax=Pelagibius litoralis TaxID=374515 RepID=A0A967KC06_9PROT|nr:trypsin-like peptidase domain-containing protein [Pelagibius litoralis]NIA70634.1 trypsin-like serine protease [Pelagibius litoralis]